MAQDFFLYKRQGRKNYIVEWQHEGKLVYRSTGTPNRHDAFARAQDIIKAYQGPQTRTLTVSEGVDLFLEHLQSEGRAHRYIRQVHSRLTKTINFKLSISQLPTAISTLELDHIVGNVSHATYNTYVQSLKSFGTFLENNQMLDSNFASRLKQRRVQDKHRVRTRAAFSREELDQLCTTAAHSATRSGFTGPQRSLAYLIAASTGFRYSEVLAITGSCCDLETGSITLPGSNTKNGQAATQPLSVGVVNRLKAFISDYAIRPGEHLFHQGRHLVRALKLDLRDAGIPYKTSDGQVRDFHSLRATYITLLIEAGMPIHDVQRLARHATPTLTLQAYAKSVASKQDYDVLGSIFN